MEAAKLLKNLWVEVIYRFRSTCPLMHFLLPEIKTSHKIGMGKKPDLAAICAWGCNVWVKQLDVGKLELRAKEGCFVGIDTESKGYQIHWLGQNMVTIKRDVGDVLSISFPECASGIV